MKWPVNRRQLVSSFKPKRYTTIVMMLIIWAGVAGSLFAGITTDLSNRDFLKGRAITIADALPVGEITALHGNNGDSATTAYRDLKERLEQVRSDQHDLRFVSLMGKKNGRVFYFVDSEAPNTNGYAPPGEFYADASLGVKRAFNSDSAFIEEPMRDQLGWSVAAYAPIKYPHTGQILAVVGIYVSATHYYEHIALYTIIPLLLAAIPLAGLIRDRKLEFKEHELGELKRQFVSIASHELRSPLTGMLWAVQSLMRAEKDMTKSQQEILLDMYRSTEASLATVNEILDLSIFERGQAHNLQHDKVDLATVVAQVVATLKLGAKEKNIHIRLDDNWPQQAYTIGDVGALKRSFMNLISNAIKYSPNNSRVDIGYRKSGAEHIITVRDQGIGIPAAEQDKVMGGYYRATNASSQQAHGTGLGLWLARMLTEQHGGRLWLRSQVNKGTTIYVALPAEETISRPASS